MKNKQPIPIVTSTDGEMTLTPVLIELAQLAERVAKLEAIINPTAKSKRDAPTTTTTTITN